MVPATKPREGPIPQSLVRELRADERGAWIMSLCSGVFTLAKAGLLDGRRATAHWMNAEELARECPCIDVELDVLYVEDGNIITSAGTAAGIDACLHLVRKELGARVATMIARRMVVPPQRDGGQRQYVELPVPDVEADSLQPLLEWAVENLTEDLSVQALARRAVMSERTCRPPVPGGDGLYAAHVGDRPADPAGAPAPRGDRCLGGADREPHGARDRRILRHHFTRLVGNTPQSCRRNFRVAS